jgi:hypothetical protein
MPQHVSSKQLDCCILFPLRLLLQPGGIRRGSQAPTLGEIRCLSDPLKKLYLAVVDQLKELWHRIGAILGVKQGIRKPGCAVKDWRPD